MSEHADLTSAERCVAGQLLAGHSTKEIAQSHDRSPRTVEWHVARLYRKTETSGRVELVLWAQEHAACCLGVPDVAA